MEHTHKYVFLRTESFKKVERFNTTYSSTDLFFCEECLDLNKINNTATVAVGEVIPDWALEITKIVKE